MHVHGDLAGRNIIVDPSTGELRALIDWERAAWWPGEVEKWAVSGEEELDFLARCLEAVEGAPPFLFPFTYFPLLNPYPLFRRAGNKCSDESG